MCGCVEGQLCRYHREEQAFRLAQSSPLTLSEAMAIVTTHTNCDLCGAVELVQDGGQAAWAERHVKQCPERRHLEVMALVQKLIEKVDRLLPDPAINTVK